MTQQDVREKYKLLRKEYETSAEKVKKKLTLVSFSRLGVFIAGGVLSGYAFTISSLTGGIILLFSVCTFLLLVRLYQVLSDKNNFLENLVRINNSELKALDGDYSDFDSGAQWIDPHHDFSHDVDLFGNDSLFQYLNRTVTGYGREILAKILSEPSTRHEDITAAQEAINEIVPKIKWRQDFMAHGLGKPLENEDFDELKLWLLDENSVRLPGYLKILVRIMPVLATLMLALVIAGIVDFTFFSLIFILNLLAASLYLKESNKVHSVLSKKYDSLSSLSRLFETFGNEEFKSELLVKASASLIMDDKSAVAEIRRLGKICQAFDTRLNMIAGVLLNGLLLWDFQCLLRVGKWKDETAKLLPEWLEKTGQADALISLATHSYNNPDFIFPELTNGEPFINCTSLGHPLIDNNTRVCNNFTLHKKGQICIITGANMAGKSTFLRTVAINLILGMAGTVVCADKFKFKPVTLFTSMRTTDSLSSKESYFFAELKRLKVLKERLEAGREVFFILDEILKGTNSTDKSNGSKLFLHKLVSLTGTGLIATHDISIGEMENHLPGIVINKCFETEIAGEDIRFDYILREGITKKMNAALLMKQMGITG